MDQQLLVGERVKEERNRARVGQPEFGAWGGITKNTQSAYELGRNSPDVAYLHALAEHGVDIGYILTGRREGEGVPPAISSAASADLVPVAEIDLAYGLGGEFADAHVEATVQHFSRAWLETITRTAPALLTFARGRGDSMQPTIQDQDIILIDRSQVEIREQDAIWALTIGDIAMVKRVRIRGDKISLLSDNDRVPPDEAHHEEVNVVGRVVFIGRRI